MHKNSDFTNPCTRNILLDHRVIEKALLIVALPLRFRAPSSLRLIMKFKREGLHKGALILVFEKESDAVHILASSLIPESAMRYALLFTKLLSLHILTCSQCS